MPVELHLLHVSLPNMFDAVPPLQAGQGRRVALHLLQFMSEPFW
jgi:hypothetical protein